MFYSWECLSFVRNNHSTLDLVVKNQQDLLCLLHVLEHNKFKEGETPEGCLRGVKALKFKMKLSYQCWKQERNPHDIFFIAIQRTLSD